jgi:hypothetical protein
MKFFGIVAAALLATSAYALPSPCGDEECPHSNISFSFNI